MYFFIFLLLTVFVIIQFDQLIIVIVIDQDYRISIRAVYYIIKYSMLVNY